MDRDRPMLTQRAADDEAWELLIAVHERLERGFILTYMLGDELATRIRTLVADRLAGLTTGQ